MRRSFRLGISVAAAAPLLSAALLAVPVGAASTDVEAAGKAVAGSSGWTQVSSGVVDMLSEITTARTADGVLHAIYTQDRGTAAGFEHAAISSTGSVLARNDILGTWGALGYKPKVLLTPTGGLRLVFTGLQDTDSNNFYSGGYAHDTISDASGASWTLQPRALTKSSSAYAAYGNGATSLADGTPVTAATLNSTISYRIGTIDTTDKSVVLNAADDAHYESAGCCLYNTQLVNSDGAIWMAWYANGSTEATNGVFAQQIHPSLGPVLKAPNSSTNASSADPDQTIAMVARPGGGVVMAYHQGYITDHSLALWQVGTSTVKKVPDTKDADVVALSAGSTGRMWMTWTTEGDEVKALHTSASGFGLGATQNVGTPTKGQSLWHVAVDASLAQGTVLVNADGASSVFLKMVKPALSLQLKPGALKAKKPGKIKVRVTEAGVGLGGVKVTIKGAKCTTTNAGKCTLKVKPKKTGRLVVKASKPGYGEARETIRVKG